MSILTLVYIYVCVFSDKGKIIYSANSGYMFKQDKIHIYFKNTNAFGFS